MKTCLPKLKEQYKANLYHGSFDVHPVRYLGPGKKLFAVGFDISNKKLGKVVSIEPKGKNEYLVSFNPPLHLGAVCHHYSKKIKGWQPTLTKPFSSMKLDIAYYFSYNDKSIRHAFYEEALIVALCDEKICVGLCYFLNEAITNIIGYGLESLRFNAYDELKKTIGETAFPEIVKHKPEKFESNSDDYWFTNDSEGLKKRINILKQAIKETE